MTDTEESATREHGPAPTAELVRAVDDALAAGDVALDWLRERGLDDGMECTLRRLIGAEGRSRAFINGQPATLQDIKALGSLLIDIHGQQEHQSLLEAANQRALLDAHGKIEDLARQVADAFAEWRSAEETVAIGFDGYAIGGLSVGEPIPLMYEITEQTAAWMPAGKPRYLMGVGTPVDLVESVARGIDMFDCVLPTRAGRHGLAYTRFGKVNLRNARYADDPAPLDPESSCPASRDYSRAYLHHLVKAGENLAGMLLTWNNLAVYQQMMADIRRSIGEGTFAACRDRLAATWAKEPAETARPGDAEG